MITLDGPPFCDHDDFEVCYSRLLETHAISDSASGRTFGPASWLGEGREYEASKKNDIFGGMDLGRAKVPAFECA